MCTLFSALLFRLAMRLLPCVSGCREVLAKLREWQATITACQALGRDPLETFELNFRFVGSPGAYRVLPVAHALLVRASNPASRQATEQPSS